ncbi:uncharacterized protein METZ01_LOCUS330746 [marine metagenome]|uniref:Uncharacterized protein n=1 Tax=marine metagenome TaxID=408172 RepID=A0A382Q0I3_9ZZZZ
MMKNTQFVVLLALAIVLSLAAIDIRKLGELLELLQ